MDCYVQFFDEEVKPPSIWCDNLSRIFFTNHVLSVRRKLVEVDLYFVHGKVIQMEVEVPHVLFD